MASTDATAIPIKNQAYRVTFPIFDADGDLVTGATGLDSEVSKDAGTFTDCTNEATEIATNSGMYYLELTATEMNADTVAIIIKTSSSGAKTTPLVFYPAEAGDIIVNVKQVNGTTQTAGDLASMITTVDDYVDTEVAAVKAVTDKLDTALELDGAVYRYTTNALEQAPSSGPAPTAAEVADAVWDELRSGHTTDGTFGKYLDTQVSLVGSVAIQGKGATKAQAKDIAKEVWEVSLGERTAKEELLAKSEFDPTKDKVLIDSTSLEMAHSKVLEALTGLQGSLRFEAVLGAIKAIKEPKDYDKAIEGLNKSLSTLDTKLSEVNFDAKAFVQSLSDFQPKMKLASEEVRTSLNQISEIQDGFSGLQKMVDEFKEKLDEQTDMDKRFAAMKTVMDKKELTDLADSITDLQTHLNEGLRQLTLKLMEQRIIILDELKK